MNNRKRYVVVGGNPFTMYTGTTTFTAIRVLCKTNSKTEAEVVVKDNYDECGGLIEIFDMDIEENKCAVG